MRTVRTWGPLLLWAAVMAVVSSIPRLRPPALLEGWDPVSHLFQFAVFGALLFRAAVRAGMGQARARWLLAAVSVLAAVAYEGHKLLVPGRHTYPHDFVTDLFGALAGLGLAQYTRWRSDHGEVPGDQGHL